MDSVCSEKNLFDKSPIHSKVNKVKSYVWSPTGAISDKELLKTIALFVDLELKKLL